MYIWATIFFFVLGTIIGSFLNVVILRYNTGAGLSGRSRCFSCGKSLKWYDLVPVLSFIFLNGGCRFCKSRISFQYPLVELLTGFLFASTFLTLLYVPYGKPLLLLYFAVESLLVVIAVYDLKHKIIPDPLVFLFGVLSLVKLFLATPLVTLLHFPGTLDLFAGPIVASPIFVLWFISGGRWIGLGDAKLALGIGWFFGFSLGISALIVGFWIGAIVSVALLLISKLAPVGIIGQTSLGSGLKNLTMTSEVPLAPFLILGFFVVLFWRFDVVGLGYFFNL